MSRMAGSPTPQPETGRAGPSLLNPDSWRNNANQTPYWLKSFFTTHFISDKADPDIYAYDLSPSNGRSGRLKNSSESDRRVYFNTMRGYGPPENDIGLPGDIYWDLTAFDRYVLWTRRLEKWVVWNWSDTKPTKTQFELVSHPFVKGRYLWGTPSLKLGWRQPSWLRDNCHGMSRSDHQDPHMLLKDILVEEGSAPEGRVSALNQVRMNIEENRRRVLLENASKKRKLVHHPPPEDQSPPRADQAPSLKPKKRLQTHQQSPSDSDSSWTPTVGAKRRRTSGVQVQTATPRRKILSTPISASVSRTSSSSESAQEPQNTRGNEDRSTSQSSRASSPRAARPSSTPPTSPSRQTAPECAVADLDLDDLIDAACARTKKALKEMMQLERKQLKKAVLAYSERNKREAEEKVKKAEEDAKKARAEAAAAKERLGQIHGLSANKI